MTFAWELPELETERLRLTAPSAAYVDDIFEYARGREFSRYIGAKSPETVDEIARFVRHMIDENEAGQRRYWLVIEKSDGRCVGSMGFIVSAAHQHGVAEFGFGLAERCWGRGIFQEASREIFAFGFQQIGLARIQAIMKADNHRAINGCIKLGFNHEATLHGYYRQESGRSDAAMLALLAEPSVGATRIVSNFRRKP